MQVTETQKSCSSSSILSVDADHRCLPQCASNNIVQRELYDGRPFTAGHSEDTSVIAIPLNEGVTQREQ